MQNFKRFWDAFKADFVTEIKIGDIGEGIKHAIVPKTFYEIPIGSFRLMITDSILVMWLAMLLMFVFAWWLARNSKPIPETKKQQLAETLVELLFKLCRANNMTEQQAEQVVPFIGTIALFITFSNLLSLFKIPPPAKSPAFPIVMALLTVGFVIIQSVRFVGIRGFWDSLVYPKAMLLPFHILDYLIKPLSLSLRLFGNVFGAFILMEFVYIVIPFLIPGIIGLWFDLADGLLQAVIFTYLCATYIGEVLESAHLAKSAREDKQAAIQPLPAAKISTPSVDL